MTVIDTRPSATTLVAATLFRLATSARRRRVIGGELADVSAPLLYHDGTFHVL